MQEWSICIFHDLSCQLCSSKEMILTLMRIKSEFREGMKKKNIKKFCILNYKKMKSIIVETFELEKLGNFSNLFKINDRSEILTGNKFGIGTI